jgi:hypothetical protein
LVEHFFARERRRVPHHGGPWYAKLTQEISSPLLCYMCTALRHALSEWRDNDGRPPAKDPAHPKRLKSGEYHFSPSNDAGRPPPDFPPQTWPNRSPAVYQQLVHTWNDLRPAYRTRVRETIHVAVRQQLVETHPTAREAPDMAATGYNAAAMDRILAEPAPVPAVSTRPAVDLAPAAVGEPAVPDVPSAADAPLNEPSPATTVGYLSSRGLCLADPVLSQRSPSPQSVASVRVCYLSCHVFAITNGRSSAVVVPDSRRRANVSCARLLVQRALGSGG